MTGNERKQEEVTFEVVDHIGVINTYSNRWTKELNVISWNGGNPKFDIRDWDEKHEKMSRGITLHEDEMLRAYEMLKETFKDKEYQVG